MKLNSITPNSYSKTNCKDCARKPKKQNITSNASDSVSFSSKKSSLNRNAKRWLAGALASLGVIGIAVPVVKNTNNNNSVPAIITEDVENHALTNNEIESILDDELVTFEEIEKPETNSLLENIVTPEAPVEKNIFKDLTYLNEEETAEEQVETPEASQAADAQTEYSENTVPNFKVNKEQEPAPMPTPGPSIPNFPVVDYEEDFCGYDKIVQEYIENLIPEEAGYTDKEKYEILTAEIENLKIRQEEAQEAKEEAKEAYNKAESKYLKGKIDAEELTKKHFDLENAKREIRLCKALIKGVSKEAEKYLSSNTVTPTPPQPPLPVFPAIDFEEDIYGYDKIIAAYYDEIFPEGASHNEKIFIVDEKITEIEEQLKEAQIAKADADAKFEADKERYLKGEITEDELMHSHYEARSAEREVNKLNAISKDLLNYVTINHLLPPKLVDLPVIDYPEYIEGYDAIINDYLAQVVFPEGEENYTQDEIDNLEIINHDIICDKLKEAQDAKAEADAQFEEDKKRYSEYQLSEEELMNSYTKVAEAEREVKKLDAIEQALNTRIVVTHPLPMPTNINE